MKRIIEDTTAVILITILAFAFVVGLSAYSSNKCETKNNSDEPYFVCMGLI